MSEPIAADEAEGPAASRALAEIDVLTQATLDDLAERRGYRRRAAGAAAWILGVFVLMAVIAASVVLCSRLFTPAAVGMVVAFVTATTVLTMAFLKATFSADKLVGEQGDYPLPPGAELSRKALEEIVSQGRNI